MINYIVVPPNKTVYFYSNYVLTNNLRIYDENKKFLGYQQKDKYTNGKDKNVYIRMRSTIPTELENDSLDKLKIIATYDNTTEYIPYQNQTINIDLKGNKLCAISDTIKDKLLIDRNGNVALQKNVNYSTFTAFTTINGSFTKSTQFILNISNCVKNVEQNRFNALSNCMLKNTTDGGMGFYGTTTSGSVRITVLNSLLNVTQEDTTSTKLNAAKTFLQNLQQTPEIYYPAEVPELIDLGQLPELLKTFNGINNVWAETNLGNTEIEIEYVQDVKKLLEQQNARLDNIEALLSTTETSALLLDNMQNDLEKEVE